MTDYFIGAEGALYDCDVPGWSNLPPLRPNYRLHHREIKTVTDYKATVRAGSHTDLGCYPLFMVTRANSALCFDCARKDAREIIACFDDYMPIDCIINYEDANLTCDFCDKPIPSAYGD